MRLSEAVRNGMLSTPQPWTLRDVWRLCGLVRMNVLDMLVSNPASGRMQVLVAVVISLDVDYRWSREKIAVWLEGCGL